MNTRSIIPAGIVLSTILIFSLPVKSMNELETPIRHVPVKKHPQPTRSALWDYQRQDFGDNAAANKKLKKLGQEMNRDKHFVARGHKKSKSALEWLMGWRS